VTILKRSSLFEEKYRVTPSVTAPGDTNPSDATGRRHIGEVACIASNEVKHVLFYCKNDFHKEFFNH